MHVFQPKISKLKQEEIDKLLQKLNISLSQLPKISKEDPSLPENCDIGDVVKIERKLKDDSGEEYFRVII